MWDSRDIIKAEKCACLRTHLGHADVMAVHTFERLPMSICMSLWTSYLERQ